MAKPKRKAPQSDAASAFAADDRQTAEALAWIALRRHIPSLPDAPAHDAHRAAMLRSLAGLLADAFDYDDADAVLAESLAVDPSQSESHAMAVHLAVQANDLDRAETAARNALKGLPDQPLAHKLLIDVLSERGLNAAALKQCSTMTKALPASPHAHMVRADVLARLGREQDAEAAYAKVASLAPAARTQVLVRQGDMKMNAGHADEAEALYREALTANLNDAKATHGLINALYAQENVAEGDRLAAEAYGRLEGFGAAYLDSWAPLETGLAAAEAASLNTNHAVLVNGLGELPGLPLGMSLIKGYVERNSDFRLTNLDLSAYYFRDLFAAMRNGEASIAFEEQDKLFAAIDLFTPDNADYYNEECYRRLAPYFFKYGSLFAERPRELCKKALNGLGPVPWFVRRYAEQIVAARPFVVGLSVTFTEQHMFSILLAKEIKRLAPDIVTVFGGGFFKAKTIESFLAADWVDYLVLHDGEVAFLKLLEAVRDDGDIRAVPNIAFFDTETGTVFHNDEGPGVKQNDLAYADYSDYDFSAYFLPAPVVPMLTSRGCYWRRCTFCDHFASYAGTYKTQSIERVVDELEHHVNTYGVRHFSFVDEMISARRFLKLSEEIMERGLDITYYALAKPTNDFNDEILQVMHKAGCRAIYWGVESASDRVLELMDKGNDVEGTSRTLKAAYAAGIRNHLFMIVGYPTETLEELKDTVRFLHDHRNEIQKIIPSPFLMMKGTPAADRYWDFGVAKAQRVRALCDHKPLDYITIDSISQADARLYNDNLIYSFFDHFTTRGIYFGTIRDQIIVCYGGDGWTGGGDGTEKYVPSPNKVFKTLAKREGVKRIASDETDNRVFPRWPRAASAVS